MKISIKILSTLILCIVILSSFGIMSFAAMPEADVEPLYENISNAGLTIGFNENQCEVVGSAVRKTGTTSMAGLIIVYKYENNDWVEIGTWENSTTRNTLVVAGTFTAEVGATYKAQFQVTAVSAAGVEIEILESTDTND